MNDPTDTEMLDFADAHVTSYSRSAVNGHATVKTDRGFFTEPTLRQALIAAAQAHPPFSTQNSSAVRASGS